VRGRHLLWARATGSRALVSHKVRLREATLAEVGQLCACSELTCNHKLWLIVSLQIVTLTFHMTHMSFAESACESAGGLDVVEECAVVAVVGEIEARGLRTILKSHSSDNGVVAGRSFCKLCGLWVADEAGHRADLLNLCGVDPVVALGNKIQATCKAQEALIGVNLESGPFWSCILTPAARPL